MKKKSAVIEDIQTFMILLNHFMLYFHQLQFIMILIRLIHLEMRKVNSETAETAYLSLSNIKIILKL